MSSRDNVIGTAIRLYAGRSGVRFLAKEESFLFSSTSFLDQPLLCSMGTVGKVIQPKFTANLHLLRRLRMSKATRMSTPAICLHRVLRNNSTLYTVYFLSRIVIVLLTSEGTFHHLHLCLHYLVSLARFRY